MVGQFTGGATLDEIAGAKRFVHEDHATDFVAHAQPYGGLAALTCDREGGSLAPSDRVSVDPSRVSIRRQGTGTTDSSSLVCAHVAAARRRNACFARTTRSRAVSRQITSAAAT
jgi:hypothetical protein